MLSVSLRSSKMDSVGLNHNEELLDQDEECTAETSVNRVPSSGSVDTDDACDEQADSPHLGDRYQVEIPTLLTENERLELQHAPTNTDDVLDAGYAFEVGLAIPITWVHHVGDQIKYKKEFDDTMVCFDNKERQIDPKWLKETSDYVEEFAGTTSQEFKGVCVDLPVMQPKKVEAYIPFPESPVVSWTDAESQSFLLGLYIFGKNLAQVKKFIGSKGMGDVLSFYYGKFYRSNAHCRWSESRKVRKRKFVHGQHIFMGWRQHELLLRLFRRVPKEIHDNLLEAAKSFTEGTTSLEEFVLSLKATVGMEQLVEAIGIGKGKHDLTGAMLELAKSNQANSTRPEILRGKAYSALTSGEIVKFLTGDFRLSKAKSNDLFWEAVWPRLLARGWHSEQPKHQSSVGAKNSLLFLFPGVEKFSRKKHTKGEHYYDCVTDVLNKVASDPMLLVLEDGEGNGSSGIKDEKGWDANDTILDKKGRSDRQVQSYTRPKLPQCSSELVKFTVVDTSLVQGEPPFKVRDLRSLPTDTYHYDSPTVPSGGMYNDSSEELPRSVDKKLGDINVCKSNAPDPLISGSKQCLLVNGHDSRDQCCEVVEEKQTENKRPKIKSSQSKYLSPVKRQRMSDCKHAGTGPRSFSGGHQFKKGEAVHSQKKVVSNEVSETESTPSPDKASAGGSLHESIRCNSTDGEVVVSQEKAPVCAVIDLNLPQLPPDFDVDRPFCPVTENPKHQSEDPQVPNPCTEAVSEQQPITNARRVGTRNRPPTTRALEALACGFLSTKRKRRDLNGLQSSDSTSRPSRRARKTAEAPLVAAAANDPVVPGPINVPPEVRVNGEYTLRECELHVRCKKENLDLAGNLYCSESLNRTDY